MKYFLLLSVSYILSHFVLYIQFVRRSSWGKTERGIFRYHFYSVLGFGASVLALCAFYKFGTGLWISALAFHGIYSLSFLELWSLSQGSYSLQLLESIGNESDLSQLRKLSQLQKLGDFKIERRLASLSGLQLIRAQEKNITLTFAGAILASFFRLVAELTGGEILKR
ncbi:MAG: hypothetical protein C5B47_03510 [Verrucomicrobia bacterium]|nr:MAG: hypothetical protein C5B47_03510 [Verrucomicrobiota bacterium]